MHDLGTVPDFENSDAQSINAAGVITGSISSAGGISHAMLYSGGVMSDLGVVPGYDQSFGLSINDSGQITGQLISSGSNPQHAFLYSGGVMTDLNALISPSSGWVLQSAQGINDFGQIVGSGTFNGQYDAFLLTPVPEPSTVVLAGLGAMGLLAAARRRGRKALPNDPRERVRPSGGDRTEKSSVLVPEAWGA